MRKNPQRKKAIRRSKHSPHSVFLQGGASLKKKETMENKILSDKSKEVAEVKKYIDEVEEVLEKAKKKYKELCYQLQNIIEASEIQKFTAHGFTFFIEEKESVSIPKSPEAKEAFFNYLKEMGMFDSMITVHSATLNSTYKSLADAALKEGILEFSIPGIEPPTSYKTLKLRKSGD